jgi:hypothetical protein
LKEFYDWGKQIGSHGLPESEHGPKLQPFTVLYNNDLKATWYLSLKGEGCKNKTHFCHLCACAKNSLTHYQIGDDWCSRCKRKGRQRCYHYEVCDVVRVDSLQNDLEVQLGSYYERHGKLYHDIQQRSKLLTDHMQANKDTDRNHIDYVIPVDSERQKEYIRGRLILATMKYKEALKLLLLHRDLSDDEIEDFQDLIDDFFEIWVGIFGDEGITNYTHMLGAGHIYYFLKKYKCLYLYSQQGWEALNGKIQTFIHQSSKQGGHHSGTRAGEKFYIY